MTQKTLLALGGSRLIVPVIDAAHALGHRVVTCDYLPDSYAHQFADDYRNASIVDREAVLTVAKEVEADGVVSFAADPGVTSAAYTAEKLGLPFQGSYEAVLTLQSKHLFREFLAAHGFATPEARTFSTTDEASGAAKDIEYPVIAKPADAAGSKGVTRVDGPTDLARAVEHALSFSPSSTCIVESFIMTNHRQISAEGFTVDGEFRVVAMMDQLFDTDGPNPYAPVGNIFPSQAPQTTQDELRSELQRLSDLLRLRTGIYNIEARVGVDDRAYILEISPRGGGNRLAEFIRAASGTDLITATVEAAFGSDDPHLDMPELHDVWLQKMLFSRKSGIFEQLWIDEGFSSRHLREVQTWVTRGQQVEAFSHASFAFGSTLMRFPSATEVESFVALPEDHVSVEIRPT